MMLSEQQGAPALFSNHVIAKRARLHAMTNAHGFKQSKQDLVPLKPSNRQAASGPSAHLRRHGVRLVHPEDQKKPRPPTSESSTPSQGRASSPPCSPSLQDSPLTAAKKFMLSVMSTKLATIPQLTPHCTRAPDHVLAPQARLHAMTSTHDPPNLSNRQAATGLLARLQRHKVHPAHPDYQQTPRSPTSVSDTTSHGQTFSFPRFPHFTIPASNILENRPHAPLSSVLQPCHRVQLWPSSPMA